MLIAFIYSLRFDISHDFIKALMTRFASDWMMPKSFSIILSAVADIFLIFLPSWLLWMTLVDFMSVISAYYICSVYHLMTMRMISHSFADSIYRYSFITLDSLFHFDLSQYIYYLSPSLTFLLFFQSCCFSLWFDNDIWFRFLEIYFFAIVVDAL